MGKHKQQGVAVVTVLWTTLIIGGLLAVVGINVVRQLSANKNNQVRNEMVSLADSISEQARMSLYDNLKTSNKTPITFLNDLRSKVNAGTYASTQIALGGGIKGAWTVKRVSEPTAEYGWVDIHATVKRGNDKQTVVRRISLGQSNVFKLAMLTETVNCMFCHFQVNGDVGTYQKFRPGWGNDASSGVSASGTGSGATSNIKGSVYSAAATLADSSNLTGSPKDINGTKVYGNVETNYKGDMLPKDKNGVPAFPPIKRSVAMANATGSIKTTGDGTGRILALPFGTNYTSLNNNKVSSIDKVYNGNVVLVGTPTDPIVLDQDIYVTGDVIIKGVVKGRGGIYAGRNLYLAGNLVAANPADLPNKGVCAGISDKTACAKKNIAAGKDEVRAAARGNIIVGDYTRFNGTNTRTPDDRQAHEFMESQFNFSGKKYFSRTTGEEVMCDNTDSNCKDIEGNPVSNGDRFIETGARQTDLQDGYSMAMRPGVVNGATAKFTSWMTDTQYANEMLTYENDTNRSWRTEFKTGTDSATTAAQKAELIAAGVPSATATTISNLLATKKNGSGNVSNVDGVTGYYDVSGGTVRFMRDTTRSYKKQVTKVDAFLYANQRIGGVILNKPAEINGGMIAREIGVLAAGLQKEWWMNNSRYNSLKNLTTCSNIAPNSEDCAMTLNYDHRLQAGGYGFNMVGGQVGQTAQWQLSGDTADDVAVN